MASIFTKIINREIPGHFVYEDDICVVLMDKFPGVKGQTLVIPKEEVDYLFDLDDKSYVHILGVAKRVAKASDDAFATLRTCVVIEGFEVPHAHIRLYPITDTTESLAKQISNIAEKDDETLALEAEEMRNHLS